MEKKELKKYLILAAIVVGICLVVKYLAVVGNFILILLAAMYPLLIGAAMAYVFNIFLSFCEKWYFPKKKTGAIANTRRPVCLVISIAIMAAFITLLIKLIVPELINAIKIISQEIPPMVVKLKNFAIKRLHDYPDVQAKINKMEIDWESLSKELFDFVKVGASGLITSIAEFIGTVTMSIVNIVVAIIFAIYLLLRKDKLKRDVRRARNAYMSEKLSRNLTEIYHVANSTFKSFFVGQFTEAIILGVLCMIGMSILKLPYAAMTGTVIGVTALIPIVGAYIGAAIGAFMICTVDPMKALIFLIFLVILQQFEGNVIYPKVVGSSVGLPGIWVLAAVTIGGGLFGIFGMLIGVPIAATIYKIFHAMLQEREIGLGIEIPIEDKPGKTKKVKREKRNFADMLKFRRNNKK